jgi:hypothetical protein
MPANTAPNKGHRYQPGHKFHPRKGPSRLTIRQQRKVQAAALERMILDMSAAAERGEPVDANNFVRLVNLQMRLQAEL